VGGSGGALAIVFLTLTCPGHTDLCIPVTATDKATASGSSSSSSSGVGVVSATLNGLLASYQGRRFVRRDHHCLCATAGA
jgi:hypothetical protein